MSTVTKILSDEHKNILKVIDALSTECDNLESGGKINKDFFEKTIDFIRNYADKFHHAKEENILFVELNKDETQMHCNPTQQMLYEHDLGRKFVKELEKGVAENNKVKIIKNGRGYAELLREHIAKEDNVLYPMADEALNNKKQKLILDKFKKIKQDKKYILFLDKLKKEKK